MSPSVEPASSAMEPASSVMGPDSPAYLSFAEDLARAAGALLKERFISGLDRADHMKSPRNIVTQADIDAEILIRSRLESAFPDHAIVGEELPARAGSGRVPPPGSGFIAASGAAIEWHVDPLDGTTNYAFNIPHWSVSIGARDSAGLLLGVVFDPLRDELFSAERGKGARCNGRPLHVSSKHNLEQALVATGFASMRGNTPDHECLKLFSDVVIKVQGVRRMGSAALDLAGVAASRFDLFFEDGLSSWDTMAGSVLVREAGGIVRDFTGLDDSAHGENFITSGRIVAGNSVIVGKFLRTFLRGHSATLPHNNSNFADLAKWQSDPNRDTPA